MSTVRPERRGLRIAARAGAAIAALVVLGLVGAGYYYASQLLVYPDFSSDELPVEVTAVDGDLITHTRTTLWEEDAGSQLLGAVRLDGYGQVGPFAEASDCCVTRPYELLTGDPIAVGDRMRLDAYAFPAGLDELDGAPVEIVRTDGPLGEYEGRYIPGSGDVFVVFAHGRGGDLHEGYRLASIARRLDVPFVSSSYRNDGWAPDSPDGHGHFGLTEWEDLEAWVRFAQERGARQVILAGSSMGGSVAGNFLRRSELADVVTGVILDSPMLELNATLDVQARARGLAPPLLGPIIWLGKAWTVVRADYDHSQLDHVGRADETFGDRPVLLFHGTADRTVPVSSSRALAEVLGEQVTYVEIDGAEHIRPWNVAPEAYATAVETYLRPLVSR